MDYIENIKGINYSKKNIMEPNKPILTTNTLTAIELQQVYEMWNMECPIQLKYNSIHEFTTKMQTMQSVQFYLLKNNSNSIIGWAYTFDRDANRWFSIMLNSNLQGKGLGKYIINEMQATETALNGWVIDHNNDVKNNGDTYTSPLNFYLKCGFSILYNYRLEIGNKISAVKITWKKYN